MCLYYQTYFPDIAVRFIAKLCIQMSMISFEFPSFVLSFVSKDLFYVIKGQFNA
jgi:hypothetical protein